MTIALVLTLLTATAIAPPEGSSAGPDDVPIGLEFDPSIAKHERKPLEATFAKTLPMACSNPPCTKDCSDDQATVGLALRGARRDYTLRWVANDPRLEAPIIIESRCELCSLVELEDQFAAELSRLCSRLDAISAGGLLELSSDPTGARVRIDGQRVGRTPWSGELIAGQHTVELRGWGRRPQQRTITIIGGAAKEHITLGPRASSRRPVWPAWGSLGLGLVMTVAGTALIAIDQQPWSGRCSGADVDDQGNCRFRLKTLPLGVGLAALGAGALASGVGLMIWAQRGPSQTCAGLHLSGQF